MNTVIYYWSGKRDPRLPEEYEHNAEVKVSPYTVIRKILTAAPTLDVKIRLRAGKALVEIDTGNFKQR